MAQDVFMAPGAFDAEGEALRRKIAMADALKKPLSTEGQMVSGHYVANPFASIANIFNAYQGGKQEREAIGEMQGLGEKRRAEMADALKQYGNMYSGTPDQTFAGPAPEGASPEGGYVQAGMKANPMAAAQFLMGQNNPQLAQLGAHQMTELPKLQMQEAQKQAELKRQEAKDAETARHNLANEERMAKMVVANRPERNVTVMGPNGEAITMPQSQSAGMPIYNPTAAKQAQQKAQQGEAKKQLSDAVAQLKGNYDTLNNNFGITSTSNKSGSNIGAAIGSSGVGQLVGSVLGTKNQEQRQEIEQTRPLLLNLIKNATGMSAQQMNSNAEMNMYLKAATDPKLSYEANMSALKNLDKMFGLGIVDFGGNAPASAAKPTPAPASNVDSLLEKYK